MITALLVPVEGAVSEVELPAGQKLRPALAERVGVQTRDLALTMGPTVVDGEGRLPLELWHNIVTDGPVNPRIRDLVGPVLATVTKGGPRGPVLVTGLAESRSCSLPREVLDELAGRWSS